MGGYVSSNSMAPGGKGVTGGGSHYHVKTKGKD
jgi:hypothetical protein